MHSHLKLKRLYIFLDHPPPSQLLDIVLVWNVFLWLQAGPSLTSRSHGRRPPWNAGGGPAGPSPWQGYSPAHSQDQSWPSGLPAEANNPAQHGLQAANQGLCQQAPPCFAGHPEEGPAELSQGLDDFAEGHFFVVSAEFLHQRKREGLSHELEMNYKLYKSTEPNEKMNLF